MCSWKHKRGKNLRFNSYYQTLEAWKVGDVYRFPHIIVGASVQTRQLSGAPGFRLRVRNSTVSSYDSRRGCSGHL